jgi:Xaa-Pro aminopeptidase
MSKIQLLREILRQYNVDSYIIPSTDEWQNEYSSKPRLSYVSGFSGSNGTLIVTQQDLILYTDSRYIAQAKIELSNQYTVLDIYKNGNCNRMKVCAGNIVGYDPMILTLKEVQYYEKLSIEYNFKLQPIDDNLIDKLMLENDIDIVEISSDDASNLCKSIMNTLPEYFGIPNANERYIEGVKSNYNFAAKVDNNYCGMISVELTHQANANIYWLGVDKQGIGVATQLINHIVKFAIKKGIKTLTVETPSPDEADDNYLKTYNFYESSGFTHVFSLKPEGYNHEMAYMVMSNLTSTPRPNEHFSEVMILSDNLAGQSSDEKFSRLSIPQNCDYLILTCPESICWLLNLRGKDIQYNTSILSYAIISKNDINFFVNIASISCIIDSGEDIIKIDNDNLQELLGIKTFQIKTKPISEFKQFLLENKHRSFALDTAKSSAWITENLLYIADSIDPIVKMRAIKNKAELDGIKLAHKIDGVAVCKFWFWLYNSLKRGHKVDEIIVAAKLAEFRQASSSFLYESFATISAYGSNAAIVHYHPKDSTCKSIPCANSDYIYLLDSGGQYSSAGTTDITRVFDIGKIFGVNKYEHKRAYTLVLKGHITLARTLFPAGTTGSQLDILARYNLWQHGMDYAHGTGHGVGHFLSVHEGPHAISARNNIPLEENMILSIEPGYYKEGSFGMRIESLYAVKKSHTDGFLQFELLTRVPIETSLVDFNLLTREEIEWLKGHNHITLEAIKNQLTSEEVEFLIMNSKTPS